MRHTSRDAGDKEDPARMTRDPQQLGRVLDLARKAVWLVMAYAFGSMVGHLILLARG